MNETLIKELVKYKLRAATAIVDHLPPELSGEIKELGRVLLESINEGFQEIKNHPSQESKPAKKLDDIPIE